VTVVPIKGHHENPKAFLLEIAEDEDIAGFVIFTVTKQGTMRRAHIHFSRQEMAFAGAAMLAWSQDHDDEP